MMRAIVVLVALACATARGGTVSFQRLGLTGQGEHGIFSVDLDGNGRRDIVGLGYGRISVYRADPAQESGYAAEPELLMTGGQAYYADVADVLPAPGKELLVLAPTGVWCFTQEAGRFVPRAKPLLECATILATPPLQDAVAAARVPNVPVLPWNFAFDADGDGRDDVLIPHGKGTDLYLQKAPGQFADPITLRLFPIVQHFGAPGHKADELRGHAARAVRIQVIVHPIERRDVNGDGKPDLASGSFWFAQKVGGGFDPDPAEIPGSLRNSLTANLSNVDIDGDGRKDDLQNETDATDLMNIITRVRVFLAGADGAIPRSPTQVVVGQNILIQPYAELPIHDFNNDGTMDFAMFKTDITVTEIAKWVRLNLGKIDGDINFFLFDGKRRRYDRRPSYTKTVHLRFKIGVQEAMMGLVWDRYLSTMMRFDGDYNADGRLDLLLREETNTVALYFNTGDPRDLFPREPDIVLRDLPTFAGLALNDLNGDGASDIILYPGNYDAILAAYISKRR